MSVIGDIAREHGIVVKTAPGLDEQFNLSGGCAFKCEGKYHVLIDPTIDITAARAVLAHELGHIFLGHLDGVKCDELEANVFGAVLVACNLFHETWKTSTGTGRGQAAPRGKGDMLE